MRQIYRTPLVLGLAAVSVLAGSLYAFADWSMAPSPAVLKLRVVAMPPGNTPSIEKRGAKAVLRWVPNKLAAGVNAQSYVVMRHGGSGAVEVCRTVAAACTETKVPDGKWSWTVRPLFETWVGADSAPTPVLTYGNGIEKPGAVPSPLSVADVGADPAPATAPTSTVATHPSPPSAVPAPDPAKPELPVTAEVPPPPAEGESTAPEPDPEGSASSDAPPPDPADQ
jgi:hypothetical protein